MKAIEFSGCYQNLNINETRTGRIIRYKGFEKQNMPLIFELQTKYKLISSPGCSDRLLYKARPPVWFCYLRTLSGKNLINKSKKKK
jgi:DNA-directed RNA polymerase subunit RPC12/RpoP